MSKAVKVTNVDATNGAKVNWKDGSGYHDVTLAPGEEKTVNPIAAQSAVKVTAVSGPVAVQIGNVGDASLSEIVSVSTMLAPAATDTKTIAGGYDSVSLT